MKRLTTILCSFFFMVSGAFLALSPKDISPPGNQIAQAAVIPVIQGKLPLDLRLNSEERPKIDSVVVHDTVTVTNTVYKRVPKLKCITDTLHVPMPIPRPLPSVFVKNKSSGDREEYTQVPLQSSKRSNIRLIVDDEVVYETENDIHSAEEGQ